MADDIKEASAEAPPKLTITKKPNPPGNAVPTATMGATPPVSIAAKKQTARIELSTSMAPTEVSGVAKAKKQTSRIPLEAGTTPTEGAAAAPASGILAGESSTGPKTIRLKRPSQVPGPKLSQPIESLETLLRKPGDEMEKPSPKKQTSRISLEAALVPEDSSGAPGKGDELPLQTIRIKRPDQSAIKPDATMQQPTQATIRSGGGLETQPTIVKSKTAKIDPPPPSAPSEEDTQSTQRRTIKLRRPDGGGTAQTVRHTPIKSKSMPEGLAAAMEESETSAPVVVAQPGKPLWNAVFAVIGIAAILVVCVLIYMLAAQAFPSSGMKFPGQIT